MTVPGDHIKYPFTEAAAESIRETDRGMVELLGDDAVRERAVERVHSALRTASTGTVLLDAETELVSYPTARVLVSLLSQETSVPVLDVYAHAEGSDARRRLKHDGQARVLGMAEELGLDVEWDDAAGRYAVAASDYINYAPDREGWELAGTSLTGGVIDVDPEELLTLIEHAVAARVRDGLPHEVSERVAEAAEEPLGELRDVLARAEPPEEFAVVHTPSFPPCLTALLERARSGEELHPAGEMLLITALGAGGMDAATVRDLTGGGIPEERAEHLLDRLVTESGLVFEPPDCEAMDEYGLCTEPDERCERIEHPLVYVEEASPDD